MRHNKINSHFIILSFFLAVFFSCSPTSSSSGGSGSGGSGGSPPETATAVQLKSSLDSGITASGTGNEGDPFKVLIDESYSLNTPSLGITDLFSNVESVVAGAGADEVSTALLDVTAQTVTTSLGSKLSIELSGANGEKKYAELYFQDAARLTKAVQSGEAVLSPIDRGKVAKDVEVTVTIYKKNSSDTSWSVDLGLLFDYEADKFDVTAYKDGDARFSQGTKINNLDQYTVTVTETIQLVFTLKGDVDPLLYPERSQLLKLIPDEKVISSLDFKDSAWGDDSKWSDASRAAQNRGEYPEDARVLESVWDEALNLLSYVDAGSENLTVKLHEADNLNIISPADETVAEGGTLTPPEFAADGDTKYKFKIAAESPSAIFEFSTADTDSIVGKKLYVKVNLTLPASTIDKAGSITNLTMTDADNPGDGLENSPYAFNVIKDKGVDLSSALVKNNQGDLSFAVRSSTDSEFTALTANTTALRVSSGERAAGNLTAGEWVLRITDSGSKEYKSKALYFKLIFPLQSSSLSLVAAYKNGGDGSLEAPVVVTVLTTGITLANLTSPASLGKSLSYEVVTTGSGLTRGTTINVSTNPSLKIDDTVETATISRGSFVLKVSEEADDYKEGGAFYFKLIFETESAELRAHADYANQSDKGKLKDAPIVVEIAPNANLTLADLIAPYSGTVTYSLEREGETSITLPSTTPLKVGEKFGSSEVLIAGDTDWTIKVSGTPPSGTEAEELYFQVTFAKAASKFGLVETLPNSRTASGNGEAYATPFVISGSFAAETAVNLKTLVDEASASATDNLTYTTVTSATDTQGTKIDTPAEALGNQAGKSVVVRVYDKGSDAVEAKTIFLQLSFAKAASKFGLVETLPNSRTASGNGETYATPFVISGSFAAETAVNLKTLVDETSAAANLTYTTVTSANDQSPGSISNPAEALNTQVAGTSVVVRVVDSGSTTVAAKTIFLKLSFKTASSFALVATLPDDRTASGNGEAYATPFVISGSFAAETAVNLKTLVDETSASAAANLTYTTVTSANDQSPGSISNPAEALNTQVAGTSVVVRVVDSGSTTVAAKTIFLKLSFKTASSFALVATLPDDRTASGNGEAYATPFVISGSFAAETAVNLKTLVDETSASAAANLTYTTVTSANDQSPGSISNPAEALNTQVAGTSVVVRVVDSGSTTVAAKTIFLKLSFKTASSFALVATLPDDRTASGNGEAYATPFVISGSFAAETAVNLKTLVDETSASAAANLTYTTVTSANDQSPGSISNPAEALNTQVAGTSVVVRVVDSGSTTVAAKTIFLKLSFKTASSFALVATLPDDRTASGNGEAYATPFVISGSFAAETAVNLKTLVDETSASAAANLTYTTVTSANDQSPGSISNPAEALNTQVAGTSVVVRVVDSGSTTVAAKTIFLKLSFKTASSFALVATLPDDRTASGNGEAYATPFVISGSFAAETAVNLKTLVDETSASAAANLTYTTVTSANDQSPGSISNPAEALNTQVAGTSVVVRVVDSGSTTVAAKTIFLQLSFAKAASKFGLVETLPNSRTASGNGEAYATPFVISGSFAAETAVNLKTLVDETSASAAANLTYTTVTSANDQSPGSISNPAEALNTQVAGTSVVVRVVDSGSTTVAAKTIFLKLSFKTASSFALVATLPDDRTASGNGEAYATPFVISGSFAAETAVNLKTLVDETSASAAANLTYTTVTSANDQSPGSISNPAEALNTQVAGTSVVVRVVDSGSTTVAAKTIFLKLSFKTASSFALVATLPDDRTASGNGEAYATPFVISGSFAAETAVNLKTLVDETSASAAANLTYTTVTSANDQSPGSISNPAEALNTQVAGTSVVVRVVDSGSTTVAAKTIFLKLSFKTASSFALVATLPDDRTASGNGEAYATPFVISGSFAAETAVNLKTLVDETSASAAANLTYTTVTSANDQSPGSISNPAEALNTQVAGTSVVVRVVDSGSTTVAAKTIFLKLSFKTASSFALVATLPDDRTASGNGEAYATPFVISGSFAAETAVNLKTLVDETSASAAANLTYTTVTSANDQSPGSISNPAEALNTQVAGTSVVVRVVDSGSTTVAAKTIFLKLSFKTASSFALVATLPDDRTASGNGEAYATPFVISGSFAAETAVNLKTLVDETSASAAANLTYTTVTSANDQSPGSISNPAEALNTQVAGTSVVVRVVDSGSTTVAAKTIFLKLSFKTASSFALVATLPDDRIASGNGEAYATPFVISGSFAAETAVNLKTLVDETSASAAANLTYTTVTSANDQSPGSISNPAEALNTQVAGTSVVVRVVDSGSTTVAAKTIFLKLSFKTASSFALVATLPDDRIASGNGETYATPFVISGSFAAETAVNLKTLVDETSASAAANLTYTTVTSANDQSPGSISNPAEALNTQVAGTSVVVRVVDSGSTTVAAKTIFLKLSFKTASSFALVATLPDDRTASGNGEAYATPFVISGSFAAETAVNLKTLVDETSASAAANLTYTTVTSANDQSPGSISNPAEALNTQVAGTSVVVRVVDSGSTTVAAKTIFLKLSFKTASSFALVATLPDDRTASGNGETYATPFVISGSFAAETAVNLKTLVDETSASAAANLTYTTVTSANDQSPGSISNPAEALNTQVAGTSVVVRVVDSGSTTVAAKTIFLKLSFKTASSFALVATLPDDRTASGNGETYATPFVISGSFAAETAVNLKTLVDETSASAAANLTYTTVTSANDQSPGSISNPAEALNTQVAGTSVVVRVVDSGSTTVAAKTIFLKLSFKTASSFALVATLPDDRTASGNGETYATPFVISGSFAAETAVNLKTLVDETSASAAANLTYTTVTSANDQSPGSISNPAEALNTQVAGTSVVVRVVDSGSTTVAAKTIFLKLSFKTASSFALVATLPDDRTASGNGEAYATPFVISGSFAAETAVNLKTLVDETSASAAANLTYTTVTSANDQSPGSISNPAEALNTQVAGTSVVVRVVDSGSTTVAAKTIFLKLSFKTASSFALVATLPDDRTASGNGETYATPFVISGSFAAETAVNLKTLVDETSASAAANLTYTTVTSANDQSPGSISNPAEALNTQVAGTSVVVRVVDSGSTTVAAKTIFLKLSFKTASSFALVATLPDDRTASGNGETYATPFVISGSFAAETAVNLKTLVDETSASAAANLTYTTVTSANDQSPGSISNPAEALNTQVAGTSVVVRVVDSGSTTVAAKTIFLKLSFKTASSFALVATLPDDRIASGNGETYATPFVISGSFAAETAVNLKTLVDETSASAAANLTYTTVTSANDQSPGSISNPAEALNTQVAGTSVVVRVVDSGSTTVAAKTIFLKLSFKTASSFALVATLPDDRIASGNGETYATPFVISGSFAAETAVNLKTLVDETSASAAANLTYTTVTSANDQSPGSISNPAEALNTQVAGTSVVVRVVDSGSTTVAAKTIFLKLSFKTPSSFAFQDQLPMGYAINGTGADFANAAILKVNGGTLPAKTAVDLTDFFKGFTATPTASPLYETVTSASDTSPGTISNPASALANQAGTSVVVRVVDSGSTTVASNTLYLSLAFATVPPTQDNRYTTVALRSGGPEVQLTGSMTAGEISFSVELLPKTTQVIYSSNANNKEFKYLYRNFDGEGDDFDLVLFATSTGNVLLKEDLPAGVYNFTLVKALSDNGYTVTLSVTDSGGTAIDFDSNNLTNDNTVEITNNNIQAFTSPVIGADAGSNRRPVRVVNNVQWAFQPAAPLVSWLGGNDFSPLANGATVGSTFVIRVPDLAAGDTLELFSVTGSTERSLETKTVAEGATSLEFVVSGLTEGASYQFFVKKPADSSANSLDSPRSVAVSVDASTNILGLQAQLPDGHTASGNGETYATPFVISGVFPANTTVNLTALVNEDSAAGELTYTTVTSATDQSPGSISDPASALANQAGKAVVVKVADAGSDTVEAKTIFLQLIFAADLPEADGRYTPALLRGGPEVQLTGSMAAGEISFSVELLPSNSDIVIYSDFNGNREFALFYNSRSGLNLYTSPSVINLENQIVNLVGAADFPAGTYNFTLRKTPSANGYTVKILVDGITVNNDTFEITNSFDAFLNPVIGADVRDSFRRPVRVVNNVQWTFQLAAPLVSWLGGNDFSPLANGATVGSTFVIRVPYLAAGDTLELFSVTGSTERSLETKTVAEGATSLEFVVSGLTEGASYQFFVKKPADSSANSLDSPRSVAVSVDASANILGLQAQLPDGHTASGNGETYATPFVISGVFPANTTVNLTALVNEDSAAGELTYTTVTSATDQSPGSISDPASALANQAGKAVVVKVADAGSDTVEAKTIFLQLIFAADLPDADSRYTPALLRDGPEVQLIGSMADGEISFGVELQPNRQNIIYSVFYNGKEFSLNYENGLHLYQEGTGSGSRNLIAGSDFPAGVYNFTLRKTPSANGYTVTILVDGLTPNNNTFDITSGFDAFFNPVVGASPGSNRRPVRVVNNVQWASAPPVSWLGGNDFSPLVNGATVGSTIVIRVPDLAAGDTLELFSVTGSTERSLETKTVAEGATSLEFVVSGLTDGASYQFFVKKPAGSSANLLDSPRSVEVTVDAEFKLPNRLALKSSLPNGRRVSGNGEAYATPFVISGIFPANEEVNLKDFVNENLASAAANLTYTVVTSADDEQGTPIANARLANQAGKSVVVRVYDEGSAMVADKTIYLSLVFAAALPSADNRYTPTLRNGGPGVDLTGSMTAGEISFTLEIPLRDQVFYKSGDSRFSYEYRSYEDGAGNLIGTVVRDIGTHIARVNSNPIYLVYTDFPAGIYNFKIVKTPQSNGSYKVTIIITDPDDGSLIKKQTPPEIREIDLVEAFTNPAIGHNPDGSYPAGARAVGNVRWAFQPAAPQVSLLGGGDFSALDAGSVVGPTFFVRVPDLVAEDKFELFSVVGSVETSLGTKTVGTGETSLEFEVSNLAAGNYQFLVKKPADSSANLLDSPRSVAVSVDSRTSAPATTALFVGANGAPVTQNNKPAGMTVTPVDSTAANAFKVGDRIFLYEINANNERVGVGSETGLAHTFTTENLTQTLSVDLSRVTFEERAYQLVVEVVTMFYKADSNFTLDPRRPADTVFDVTFDSIPPQLSFNFTDLTTLVISANEALVGNDVAADIQGGLTFTGSDPNPTVSGVTYDAASGVYTATLSQSLAAGAVLNFAEGIVVDAAGNRNVGIQQEVLPSLVSIVASPNRIDASSTSTTLTFNFAQEIDASSFKTDDDLEIVAASGSVSGLSFGSVTPDTGASQTIRVTLTAPSGFDNHVRVRMKATNEISLPGNTLTAKVTGESPLIDIDLKAPTPTVSFSAAQVAPSAAVQFTLSFDEAVTGDIEDTDFTAAAGGSVTNINRTDDRTFTGILTAPSTPTTGSLSLKAGAVTDAYGNSNDASVAAAINVVNGAVPVPSFSAAPLARHGGSTTLTISFPAEVTGFAVGDLSVTDAGGNTDTVTLSEFPQGGTDPKVYTVKLTTQDDWVSGAVTVSVAAGAYNANSSPALSYVIPVSNALTAPILVSVQGGETEVTESSDTRALPLGDTSVKVDVSAVAGDSLVVLRDHRVVATHTIATTGVRTIEVTDDSFKGNGTRSLYRVRLNAGDRNEASRLLYVDFAEPGALTPPTIRGAFSVSFVDDFSTSSTNWSFKSGKGTSGNNQTGTGSAEISNGALQLTDARAWQYGMATHNDLIFSTQGRVVFEGTFIFGDTSDPADGIAFFSYDAQDELFYPGRTYAGDGDLVVTNGRLPSLFFAIGLDEYRRDELRYAPPAANPADLSNLANPTGGNESGWDDLTLDDEIWSNARHRLRITVENRSVLVERANVDTNGVVDESSWQQMLQKSFPGTTYVPDNMKIGFTAATGGRFNYHAIDDVKVDAELFVPYTVGGGPVQASPRGVTLTAGKQTDGSSSLAISGIRVRISSGYQITDSLTFSGDSTLFTPTLAGETLTIRTVPGSSPTTAQFLAALNAIRFSATAAGERTLSWQVFAKDAEEEVPSQFYNSEIRVFTN